MATLLPPRVQLKERFQQGYDEGREARREAIEQKPQQQDQEEAAERSDPGAVGSGALQETLRGAKERIDEETRMLKERFRHGYQDAAHAEATMKD
ncbi:hypothetical protein GPECTOR_10g954 [Gonium pectorale]|uniref:Uncharacterized protein n=1 Tax=Gonium pectorale TaxID=33097 RepID=A0A150GRE1_GONPE|nr:hypothetical protein GPECTOR_10g954 [Gonium pectorale]|eukprot:KXZ52322.1 hypothetical protein GPECTOR_10g954 [Gonium pectorale]